MVWLLTGSGWLLVGAVAGWQTVDFIPWVTHFNAPVCGLLGVVGGVAGGAAIAVFGVGTADPAWILSMFTCVGGAVGAVLLAAGGTSLILHARRRS